MVGVKLSLLLSGMMMVVVILDNGFVVIPSFFTTMCYVLYVNNEQTTKTFTSLIQEEIITAPTKPERRLIELNTEGERKKKWYILSLRLSYSETS